MKKIIFIVKDFENETEITTFEVKKYFEQSICYELIFNDNSYGCIPKERVLKIEKKEKKENE